MRATNELDFGKGEGKVRCGCVRRNVITVLQGSSPVPERHLGTDPVNTSGAGTMSDFCLLFLGPILELGT